MLVRALFGRLNPVAESRVLKNANFSVCTLRFLVYTDFRI